MADGLPRNFLPARSPAIASYSFSEIASNLGFITYYGVSTKDRSTESNNTFINYLTENADVWPTNVKISQTAVATTAFNFDTSVFNMPSTVRGTAIFNACLTNEEADNQECIVFVQLFKVLAGGSTAALSSQIAWRRTDQMPGAPDASLSPNEEENMLILLDLTTTNIAPGEKLRLVVSLQMISGAGTDTMNVYCDPQGSTIFANAGVSTKMKVFVPFVIN